MQGPDAPSLLPSLRRLTRPCAPLCPVRVHACIFVLTACTRLLLPCRSKFPVCFEDSAVENSRVLWSDGTSSCPQLCPLCPSAVLTFRWFPVGGPSFPLAPLRLWGLAWPSRHPPVIQHPRRPHIWPEPRVQLLPHPLCPICPPRPGPPRVASLHGCRLDSLCHGSCSQRQPLSGPANERTQETTARLLRKPIRGGKPFSSP